MSLHKSKFGINQIMTSLLFVVLVVYFSYHAVIGERGFLAFLRLSQKIELARAQLDIVHAERMKYERNVKLLRSNSLDLDLLDEQARRVLGYADKDEKVYNLE